MKGIKTITSLLFTVAMAVLVGNLLQFNLPGVLALFMGFVALSLFVRPQSGVAFMAVTKEIWENDIIGNLFMDNQFASLATNADQYVLEGKVVHIPNAGAPSPSVKNATVFPINAVQRADTDIAYVLDNYFQPPKFVQNVEQAELSYDKRVSIMGEQMDQLIQDAMDGLLIRWGFPTNDSTGALSGAINYVLTDGAASSSDLIDGTAAGTRLQFTIDAIKSIKKAWDNANIPVKNRYAVLTANHYNQLVNSFDNTALTNFYRLADASTGILGSLLGFTFLMRPKVQRWRLTGGVWAPVDTQAAGFAAGANDSAASLFFQTTCVERARGDVKVFDDGPRAEYYGEVFSMNMRLGGRIRRPAGVTAVIEAIGA